MLKSVAWFTWEAGPFHCKAQQIQENYIRLPVSVQELTSIYTAPIAFPLLHKSSKK